MIIHLKNIRVFANHGWYEEERQKGHWFCISVEIKISEKENLNDDLKNTLNYELVYQIVLEEMKHTQNLLETVVQNILTRISKFNSIEYCTVKLMKENPYKMEGVGAVGIEMSYKK